MNLNLLHSGRRNCIFLKVDILFHARTKHFPRDDNPAGSEREPGKNGSPQSMLYDGLNWSVHRVGRCSAQSREKWVIERIAVQWFQFFKTSSRFRPAAAWLQSSSLPQLFGFSFSPVRPALPERRICSGFTLHLCGFCLERSSTRPGKVAIPHFRFAGRFRRGADRRNAAISIVREVTSLRRNFHFLFS